MSDADAIVRRNAVDCLTEANTFYGSDFLSTKQVNASSPADCCAQCKAAGDCTVWIALPA